VTPHTAPSVNGDRWRIRRCVVEALLLIKVLSVLGNLGVFWRVSP
jgi:hypothetical protein